MASNRLLSVLPVCPYDDDNDDVLLRLPASVDACDVADARPPAPGSI